MVVNTYLASLFINNSTTTSLYGLVLIILAIHCRICVCTTLVYTPRHRCICPSTCVVCNCQYVGCIASRARICMDEWCCHAMMYVLCVVGITRQCFHCISYCRVCAACPAIRVRHTVQIMSCVCYIVSVQCTSCLARV